MSPEAAICLLRTCLFFPRDGGASFIWTGLCASGLTEDGSPALGRPYQPLGEDPGAVVGQLEHVACYGEPLAVLAALVTSASSVSVMTFFSGLHSVSWCTYILGTGFLVPLDSRQGFNRCYWMRLFLGFSRGGHGTCITGI